MRCVTPKILDNGTMNNLQAAWCWSLMLCLTEFRQPLQVQSHLEMPRILVQLGPIQRT